MILITELNKDIENVKIENISYEKSACNDENDYMYMCQCEYNIIYQGWSQLGDSGGSNEPAWQDRLEQFISSSSSKPSASKS